MTFGCEWKLYWLAVTSLWPHSNQLEKTDTIQDSLESTWLNESHKFLHVRQNKELFYTKQSSVEQGKRNWDYLLIELQNLMVLFLGIVKVINYRSF